MKKLALACIIDDDPIFSFVAKKMFESHSFANQILSFSDGKEAFDGLSSLIQKGETLPEVILLDLNMPVMDGWEFLDSFLKVYNQDSSRIYIVSSSIDPADIEKSKTYTIVKDFISKPLTEETLNLICSD